MSRRKVYNFIVVVDVDVLIAFIFSVWCLINWFFSLLSKSKSAITTGIADMRAMPVLDHQNLWGKYIIIKGMEVTSHALTGNAL